MTSPKHPFIEQLKRRLNEGSNIMAFQAQRERQASRGGRQPDLQLVSYSDADELLSEQPDSIVVQMLPLGAMGDLTEQRAREAASEWEKAMERNLSMLVLTIDGYDDDPRELWMIPEVCAHVCLFARIANITVEQATKLIPDACGAGLLAACGAFGEDVMRASLATYKA
jgi:hypothetical protein